ncbi:hypothetical protein [Nostoc sp.]|uniref:hypothetical protein n=1 Tax=Nostoc sp. TaxID=1180 RepID=UPI002FEFFA21
MSSLPFIRGGLGWGKTQIRKLLQTCLYTTAINVEDDTAIALRGCFQSFFLGSKTF